MPVYIPPALSQGILTALGAIPAPLPPRVVIESTPVEASLRQHGTRNETVEYSPRVNRGAIVTTTQNERLTVIETVSDPFQGLVTTETASIDIGTGTSLPVEEPVIAPIYEPVTIDVPPTLIQQAPLNEEIPYTAPSAELPGANETTPLTVSQDAYLQEQLEASGCQTREIFDFAPDGFTFLGSRIEHWDGAYWSIVEYRPLY